VSRSADRAVAEVAVAAGLRQTFHYRIPDRLLDAVRPGVRVRVPFGRQRKVGYVVGLGAPPPDVRLVDIAEVLDTGVPTFTPAIVEMLRWMSAYYRAPLGELCRAAHPAGTESREIPAVTLTADGRAAVTVAREPYASTLRALLETDGPQPVDRLDPPLPPSRIKRMVERGWLTRSTIERGPRVTARTEPGFQAVAPAPDPVGGGRVLKRDRIHSWLVGRGTVPRTEIEDVFGRVAPHLKQLVGAGRIAEVAIEVVRDPFFGEVVDRDRPPTLSGEQRRAVDAIAAAEGYAGFLLQGVTGSGKTEVYLHALAGTLERGRGGLVLVPEIALTPQLVRRFRARFGDELAVLHSGLSDGQRYDQWRRLRDGTVRVAIGARSAIFAPVHRLGLIVVDESHDPSFKQEDGVRYHARDMALLRGAREGAAVVLGSATPSLESLHNASIGKLTRLVLAERPTGGRLPAVELVDLRVDRPPDDEAPFLSVPLRNALAETLGRGEQSILFLNRRGFSSFVHCTRCGEPLSCEQCAISMVFHKRARLVRCHYCDTARGLPGACPSCGAGELELGGRGTERVEEALSALFPEARVARLDRDTAQGRGLRETLAAMRAGRIDILVGTQMVTKGHDFPRVTLVGVLSADDGLTRPDFRAGERTFQRLAQVAGRAGRADRPGRVLVQTWNPEHPCLAAVRAHDHAAFATTELTLRRMMGYPPYSHAAAIRVDGREPAEVEQTATRLGALLRDAGAGTEGSAIRGPAPAPLEKLRGRTRWSMLLTAETRARLRVLLEALEAANLRAPGDVRWAIDVDPQSFM
jgi:primosomal protein N' (replication factor Y)